MNHVSSLRRSMSWWCVAIACAAMHARAGAQSVLFELNPPFEVNDCLFGTSLCSLGDVNGDGISDIAVGDPLDSFPDNPERGAVRVFSGGTLTKLYLVSGKPIPQSFEWFAKKLAAVGDVDGDGRSDFLVGADLSNLGGTDSGRAELFSGKTGASLGQWTGDSIGDRFGGALAAVGDIDLDGVPDFAIGAIYDDVGAVNTGSVRIISGATRATTLTLGGTTSYALFGRAIAGLGDIDTDGIPDLAIGHDGFFQPSQPGTVRVVAGTGASLFSIQGASGNDGFGQALASAGDVDLDGVTDLVIGAPIASRMAVVSGATGSALFTRSGSPGTYFGRSVAGGGDYDGDGVPDVIVGVPSSEHGLVDRGAVTVLSGAVALAGGGPGEVLVLEYGERANDEFGTSVAFLGDLAASGATEIGAGAPSILSSSPSYVRVFGDDCGDSESYGQPCNVGAYKPSLFVTGCFAPSGHIEFHAGGLPTTMAGFILLGTSQATTVIPGGCVVLVGSLLPVLVPTFVPFGFGTGQPGTVFSSALPPGMPTITLYTQILVASALTNDQWKGTPGVRIQFE